MGWLPSLLWANAPSLFDLKGDFLHMCSWEGLLVVENDEYVVFHLCRAQLFSHSCYFGVFVHRGWTPAAQPGAHLCPASDTTAKPQLSFIVCINIFSKKMYFVYFVCYDLLSSNFLCEREYCPVHIYYLYICIYIVYKYTHKLLLTYFYIYNYIYYYIYINIYT